MPSQDESKKTISDEAETVVDQFGWRIENEDQNPKFFHFQKMYMFDVFSFHFYCFFV